MTDISHGYDIRIPDDEIRQRMTELEHPHRDEKVLKYLHFELKLSSRELGSLFGVTRQAIQNRVRDFEWDFRGRRSTSYHVTSNQLILSDFEKQSGFNDFL